MESLYDLFPSDPEIEAHEHDFPVYERFPSRDRGRPVKMLEIGVDRGGSLKLWKRYLGPESRLYGIDVKPECTEYSDPAANVEVFIGSQADPVARTTRSIGFYDRIVVFERAEIPEPLRIRKE